MIFSDVVYRGLLNRNPKIGLLFGCNKTDDEFVPLLVIKICDMSRYLNDKHFTRKIIALIARLHSSAIRSYLINPVNDLYAVLRSPYSVHIHIKKIPYYSLSEKIIFDVVLVRPWFVKEITEDRLTPDVINTALKVNPNVIKAIPSHLITYDIVKRLFEGACDGFMSHSAFKHIPDHLLTPEMIQIMVSNASYTLKYVPKRMQTPELCFIALRNNMHLFKFVRLKGVVDEYERQNDIIIPFR